MTDNKHVHKLRRHLHKSGTAIYFCVLDCPYKTSLPLALGKKCICWRCGEEFVMNEYSIRLAKPHCQKCHKVKEEKRRDTDTVAVVDVARVENGQVVEHEIIVLPRGLSLQEKLSNEIKQAEKHSDEEI